jgi:hypothetical protein
MIDLTPTGGALGLCLRKGSMRRADMLRHAQECRQWAGTARTEQAKAEFLKAADIWDLLASQADIDDPWDNPVGHGPPAATAG